MSYTISITVNLPDNVEVDMKPYECDSIHDFLDSLLDTLNGYAWTSAVITVVNSDPPKAVKTFVEPL